MMLNFSDVAKDAEKDSFAEKLFTNVIKNLELTISNIHIRYEDKVTNPASPFSVGVTLHELSCTVSSCLMYIKYVAAFSMLVFICMVFCQFIVVVVHSCWRKLVKGS